MLSESGEPGNIQESVCESGEPGNMQGSLWVWGSLEACKRASVSLANLFEVSHYARFARALVVTTIRHSCAHDLVKFESTAGPDWNQIGINV